MQQNSTIKPTRALGTSAKARNGVSLCKRTNEIEECKQYSSAIEFKTKNVARSYISLGKLGHLMIH